jgi:hypothetical protein
MVYLSQVNDNVDRNQGDRMKAIVLMTMLVMMGFTVFAEASETYVLPKDVKELVDRIVAKK